MALRLIILTAVSLVLLGSATGAFAQTEASPVVDAPMPIEGIMFWIVAAAAALSALGCVIATNVVRMAMCLFGTLGAVALLYFLMGAMFLGAIQLIVYVGGTLIVIVFGVMLTTQAPWSRFRPARNELLAGGVVTLALFAVLATVLTRADWGEAAASESSLSTAAIGEALLTTYLVPFEVVSVLLLAVMIGAAYLARRERD